VRATSLETFAVVTGFAVIGCSAAGGTALQAAIGGSAGAAGAQVAAAGAATGGSVTTGGTHASSGGTSGSGGAPSSGGTATGGMATGGAATGGFAPTGGSAAGIDCNAAMPTSGAQEHSGNTQGGSGNLAWSIWSNGGPGYLTTYAGIPAFTASWSNSGDYLGRMGFEWGNSGQAYTAYGTIEAEYVWRKSGTAGNYSYLGVYGWSNNPCIEWYIVEDSFHTMPFNTGTAPSGTAQIDGATYNLVHRNTTGTGGNRCGNVTSWDQFYSIRLEGSQCGTITVSDHFDVWAARGWNLGNLLEVKIVVEAAAGQGSVDFPIANVTTTR
jgi:hypothetical protein